MAHQYVKLQAVNRIMTRQYAKLQVVNRIMIHQYTKLHAENRINPSICYNTSSKPYHDPPIHLSLFTNFKFNKKIVCQFHCLSTCDFL